MKDDFKVLVGRLTGLCRQQLESATGVAFVRGHDNVQIEHVVLQLLRSPGSDMAIIAGRKAVPVDAALAELTRSLDRIRAGTGREQAFSPYVVTWLREAWLAALFVGSERIRSGHLLLALLDHDLLSLQLNAASPSLGRLRADELRGTWEALTEGGAEGPGTGAADAAADGPAAGPAGDGGSLSRFCIDLTQEARAGRLDPVIGRDEEIRQVLDILTRRRQNNAILTGEPGVGKTAVAEGLAARIAAGSVPDALKEVRLLSLDLGLLQAGAGARGEFENRLRGIVEDVQSSLQPIVLFIDEAHTLIGAGGQPGQNDAANLLKPALARGALRCLAATTWSEYKRYFEKDAALSRRFQVVALAEPDPDQATAILRGLVGSLERHHGVRILDEAVTESVRLSARYIASRQLPDKAVSLLDTACSRVRMSQATVPPPIEARRHRLSLIETEDAALARELVSTGTAADRRAALSAQREALQQELTALEARWETERSVVERIVALRRSAESTKGPVADGGPLEQLARETAALREVQGEAPLVHPVVDGQAVAEIVASWTGIPLGRMVADDYRAVLELGQRLGQRVAGQGAALDIIAESVQTHRAGLTDPRKPVGVFLLVGTTGVGKTETALALADLLYGGEQNLTVINMNEYKEEHKVSLLLGAPPGYVGYGEGGVLTEAIRRRPFGVVLLDEMEKAHPGLQDVFYQAFDKGQLKDGEGRSIDCRNTVFMMTSNAGEETIGALFRAGAPPPDAEQLQAALRPELLRWFRPAFLGRCAIIPYMPLSDELLSRIVDMQLARVAARVRESQGIALRFAPDVAPAIAARCRDTASGARGVEAILRRSVLPGISVELLAARAAGRPFAAATFSLDGNGQGTVALHEAGAPGAES